MAANSGSPPTHTIKPINPPPPSDQPTSAMLKAEIDSGRTDDKVGVFDPELSTLGTDNKATGQPPSPFRFTLARFHEALGQSIRGGETATDAHKGWNSTFAGFLGLVVAIGVALLVGVWIGAR